MHIRRFIATLALLAGLTLAAPSLAAATPVAQTAGGDVAPLTPAVVNVPIVRTEAALERAALQIEQENEVRAGRSLAATRRYLTRSFNGAQYLIANPPPVAEEARASARSLRRLAHRAVRDARRESARGGWIRARASGDVVGPTFVDGPTAVFAVLTSQYQAATQTIGLLDDATGATLTSVRTTLERTLDFRDRLVRLIHTSFPTPPEEEDADVTTFDVVMPGLVVLLDDELQQLRAAAGDDTLPAAARAAIADAIRADQQIKANVNAFWPPAED